MAEKQRYDEYALRINCLLVHCQPTLAGLLQYLLDQKYKSGYQCGKLPELLKEHRPVFRDFQYFIYDKYSALEEINPMDLGLFELCELLKSKSLGLMKPLRCCDEQCCHDCLICKKKCGDTIVCYKKHCSNCGIDSVNCPEQLFLKAVSLVEEVCNVAHTSEQREISEFFMYNKPFALLMNYKSWEKLWRGVQKAMADVLNLLCNEGAIMKDGWKDLDMEMRNVWKRKPKELVFLYQDKLNKFAPGDTWTRIDIAEERETNRQRIEEKGDDIQQSPQSLMVSSNFNDSDHLSSLILTAGEYTENQPVETCKSPSSSITSSTTASSKSQQQLNSPPESLQRQKNVSSTENSQRQQDAFNFNSQQHSQNMSPSPLATPENWQRQQSLPLLQRQQNMPLSQRQQNTPLSQRQHSAPSADYSQQQQQTVSPAEHPLRQQMPPPHQSLQHPQNQVLAEGYRSLQHPYNQQQQRQYSHNNGFSPTGTMPRTASSPLGVDSPDHVHPSRSLDYMHSTPRRDREANHCPTESESQFDPNERVSLSLVSTHGSSNIQETMTPIFCKQGFEKYHKGKNLVLIRGLPGSGKTTLANKVIFDGGVIFSTDDFFRGPAGKYCFDGTKLPEAHKWNQDRAHEEMKKGTSPICIDNTNLVAWEMKPYVTSADSYKYQTHLIKTSTSWALIPNELVKRTSSGIPKKHLEKMMKNYDEDVKIADIRKSKSPRK